MIRHRVRKLQMLDPVRAGVEAPAHTDDLVAGIARDAMRNLQHVVAGGGRLGIAELPQDVSVPAHSLLGDRGGERRAELARAENATDGGQDLRHARPDLRLDVRIALDHRRLRFQRALSLERRKFAARVGIEVARDGDGGVRLLAGEKRAQTRGAGFSPKQVDVRYLPRADHPRRAFDRVRGRQTVGAVRLRRIRGIARPEDGKRALAMLRRDARGRAAGESAEIPGARGRQSRFRIAEEERERETRRRRGPTRRRRGRATGDAADRAFVRRDAARRVGKRRRDRRRVRGCGVDGIFARRPRDRSRLRRRRTSRRALASDAETRAENLLEHGSPSAPRYGKGRSEPLAPPAAALRGCGAPDSTSCRKEIKRFVNFATSVAKSDESWIAFVSESVS